MNHNKFDNPTSHMPQAAALQWACEVLGLEPQGQTIGSRETGRQALSVFFNRLNLNEFYVEPEDAEAVDIIFGKPAHLAPSFQKHYTNQQFERLDEVVEWYAGMLGTGDNERLIEMLGQKLSGYDSPGVPQEVYAYASRIYEIAPMVQPPTDEPNLAVKKIVQALFHISTIRPSARVQVRQKWTEKLQQEFSTMELTAAKSTIAQRYKTPSENSHRPFLSMLTFDDTMLERYQIRSPVATGIQPRVFPRDSSSPNKQRTESGAGIGAIGTVLFALMLSVILVSGIVKLITVTSQATSKSKTRSSRPAAITKSYPKFKFDPDLPADDPASAEKALELMLIMEGASPEERAQKLKEFKEIADKARVARQELKNKHWTEEEIDKLAKKFAEAQTKLPPEKRIDALLAKEAESSAAAKEAQRAISPPVVPPSARSGFEDDYRRATPDLLGRKSTSRESPMDTVEKIMREQRERDAARKREINDIMKRNREMMQQHNDAIRKSFDGIPRQRSVPPGLPQFRSPLGRPQSNPFGRNFP